MPERAGSPVWCKPSYFAVNWIVLLEVRALHDRFEVLHDAEAELEADVGAVVEAEQVAQLRAEAVVCAGSR